MKKISIVCVLVALASIFFSCEKETILNKSENSLLENKTNGIDLSQVPNYLDGKLILNVDTLERFGDNLISFYDGEDNLIYNFSSKENFYNWVKYRTNGSKIIKIDESMDFLSDYADKCGAIAYYEQTGEILEEYQLVADSIAKIFTGKNKNLIMVLHDLVACTGSEYAVVGAFWPSFGSFNNKTTSVEAPLCLISALCDLKWFRATRFYITSFAGSLDHVGNFDNKAESLCLF